MRSSTAIVSADEFTRLIEVLTRRITSDSQFFPDTILGLSRGGFPVAAALANRLNIGSRGVIGLPVYVDITGEYYLDSSIVTLNSCHDRSVLVVDEASKSGRLCSSVVAQIEDMDGKARSAVLIARNSGIMPYYVAETCTGEPPKFFWEIGF